VTPDVINAFYEAFGGALIGMSIWRLYKDGQVKGVSLVPVVFFATWGYWNLYFYPALEQWWSFWGGVLMVTMNTVWLLQMAWYIRWPRLQTQEFVYDDRG